ncbi:MAG: tRNA (adenosine(37)-N6)-threonylcarbamoyltransferase complex ATPase subunit type 1 TsaE [Lunatimonas sp.]|uniref:tRNA (adenosine(37)-N6)-threonylcarbamoyltransferase complex ATPase subunit type 1 TsaE n=1 Tax=Lunatimonas sp. TaxID=2060141 RepID=UPI00263B16DD|nr:tRNA (adenosine(37)-N6)-threonylcarbamoyltransferase complex ATPase subunit type 1 TsaE [Lunatimonas sp.]MCC5939003.1 tRNA (adenosine(37)-N6)-threonylcarbamoyltransferase complex ATPase subunit type 1 TsaE [Lunatimonas sp.]
MKRFVCARLQDIDFCAKEIIESCRGKNVWVFKGPMGAGKTTIIRAIASQMGIVDNVSSPTFGLVNEYGDTEGNVFYHFDFYRIEDQSEAVDMGVDEYFGSGSLCWVEWGERIPDLIPSDAAVIAIHSLDEYSREITIW